jgi:Flp pilus assembly protein TadG
VTFDHRERGQAATELALLLPLLLVVLAAIFEIGRTVNDYMQVTSAAREAARQAAVGQRSCADAARVADSAARDAAPGLDWSRAGVRLTTAPCPSGTLPPGSEITVTVTYPASIDILGQVVYSTPLSGSTTMRVES